MTLIEIGIALAIAAGLVALAVPAISNVARVQLRQKSGHFVLALPQPRQKRADSRRIATLCFAHQPSS